MLESLSQLSETPAEPKGNPLLDEEACDNESVGETEHTQVTLFSIRDYVTEEGLDGSGNAVKTAQDVLHNFLGKSDAQLGDVLNLAGERVEHRVFRQLLFSYLKYVVQSLD